MDCTYLSQCALHYKPHSPTQTYIHTGLHTAVNKVSSLILQDRKNRHTLSRVVVKKNLCLKNKIILLLPLWEGREGCRKVGDGRLSSRESSLSESQLGNKVATPVPAPQSPSKNQSLCSSSPTQRDRGGVAWAVMSLQHVSILFLPNVLYQNFQN